MLAAREKFLTENKAPLIRNYTQTDNEISKTSIETKTSVQRSTQTSEIYLSSENNEMKSPTKDEPFSNMPPREPTDLEFKNLSLLVNLGFRKGTKEILHDVCGKFPGNQLIAIMGPSGAGKSTLLDVLSGFKTTGVDGSILLNGRRRDLTAFRRMSCYITQDDRLQPLLTVYENMQIAAGLKFGPYISPEEKAERIESILLLLGLYQHDLTLTKLLSGGQKKRLSIAMELLNNPTIMFLDEPTTGLDSSSCSKVLQLLKKLACQGRTIICTIHQPTAKLFEEFNQVYVLSTGYCVYQGSTKNLVPFLQTIRLPCPMYHNPADYIIELACGEYGNDKVEILKLATQNGKSLVWFDKPDQILNSEALIKKYPVQKRLNKKSLEDTNFFNQLNVLIKRGWIKTKRDTTLTHLRIAVNVFMALILGLLYYKAGNEGSRVLDNYNLLFAILMHHSMTTMMLTVLTFPIEMSILLKEHFNRWYSLKSYYASITILDLPLSIFCCFIFSATIYIWSHQPMEISRFSMFFGISILVVLVGHSFGLIIGAWFNIVNGTFLAPVLTIPMMMFAGFGVTLRDLPYYLEWGSHISYLRYGLEGFVSAIYGQGRETLSCNEASYCHYRYPNKFLTEITMQGDMFWNDFVALLTIVLIFKITAYFILKAKITSVK
ncbi:ATP-binding cassette sub-family G member 4 [Episyrphus balteatus]|uniref:ATP-binding cassette sub-family G member 4 n=1 Tax=Episyrphus balteatus TaxID=286459 RepID=UPI002485CDC7|nr:ATP-binding cassette sub-family G member 4 [Episyrphus balteatus]XP_055837585.1 ATP-binding cassette sub-family G member 4 [Episyrphus balteatus]XP_055837586.1 ATP-binding cassette sub-family G member 4 [Episyrphus balteatus]